MFTGLVEEIGTIRQMDSIQNGYMMHVQAKDVVKELKIGDSIAVNGICLTVIDKSNSDFAVEAVGETVSRSTLANFQPGYYVNLERALRPDSRIGGHFVQGHVDQTGEIVAVARRQPGFWFKIKYPNDLEKLLVEKGSVAVDGISLTIAHVDHDGFDIAVITHTFESTTLKYRKPGDQVNLETDILGKYVYRFLTGRGDNGPITEQKLTEWGFV